MERQAAAWIRTERNRKGMANRRLATVSRGLAAKGTDRTCNGIDTKRRTRKRIDVPGRVRRCNGKAERYDDGFGTRCEGIEGMSWAASAKQRNGKADRCHAAEKHGIAMSSNGIARKNREQQRQKLL